MSRLLKSYPLPELLAPAGDLRGVATALLYGADAVYVGGSGLSLRAKATGVSLAELDQAITLAHSQGAKIYYCLNLLALNRQLGEIEAALAELAARAIDGLIIADPGVMRLAKKIAGHIPIHVSTQANTSNSESAAFWRDFGVARVNLARELSFKDLRAIMAAVPDLECEIFVHGAMCMAISGRCSLSTYLSGRSANQGLCAHPCRYQYRSLTMSVEEQTRPGLVTWEVEEEEEFSAFFAAEDLCLLPYLAWLWRVGMRAVKIEGRTKSVSYLGQVTDLYRSALNDLAAGRFRHKDYLRELSLTATRDLATGFFLPRRRVVMSAAPKPGRGTVLAQVLERVGDGAVKIQVLHSWSTKQRVQAIQPGLKRPDIGGYCLEKLTGERLSQAHSGMVVILRSDHPGLMPHLLLRAAFEPVGD